MSIVFVHGNKLHFPKIPSEILLNIRLRFIVKRRSWLFQNDKQDTIYVVGELHANLLKYCRETVVILLQQAFSDVSLFVCNTRSPD